MSKNALFECPACKANISFEAATCPKCGQPITDETKDTAVQKQLQNKKNSKIKWLAAIIIGLVIAIFMPSGDKGFKFSEEEFINALRSRENKLSFNKMRSEKKEEVIYEIKGGETYIQLDLTLTKDKKIKKIYIQYQNRKAIIPLRLASSIVWVLEELKQITSDEGGSLQLQLPGMRFPEETATTYRAKKDTINVGYVWVESKKTAVISFQMS